MICQTPVHQVCNYGADAQYLQPPSTEQILNGVIPLDSLPADWWNFLWNDTNRAVNEARTGFTQVLCELNTVLSCASITANRNCYNQLYQSINKIRQTIGTSSVAGAVKSSSTNGQVSIATTGIMTVNGLGNVSNICYGSYSSVVLAVNCFRNWAETCFGNVSTCLASLGNGKAPTNHASTATTYGIGTQANYGHIKLCSCTNSSCGESSGIAATPAAVKSAYDKGSTALTCAQSAYTLASGRSTVPTNHASTATTYGIGTQANYGHIKLCSCINSSCGESSGIAATPAAVKSAYDKGSTALTCAQSAYTLASGRSTVPTNHASTATTYGIGTQTNYGHIKLCSCTNSSCEESSGIAATPAAVKSAYDKGSTALTCAQSAYTLASGRSTVPTNHASTATTYGIGTQANYGHIKLCSCTNSSCGESNGIAATPAAVKSAYDKGSTALTCAQSAYTLASGRSTVPTNHASTATTYGIGTQANYGHIKLCSCINSSCGESSGIAATPAAVNSLKAYTTQPGPVIPVSIGSASAGSSNTAARADHSHSLLILDNAICVWCCVICVGSWSCIGCGGWCRCAQWGICNKCSSGILQIACTCLSQVAYYCAGYCYTSEWSLTCHAGCATGEGHSCICYPGIYIN